MSSEISDNLKRDLLKINIKNALKIINFKNSILTLDRGYVSLELMAWLIEHRIFFVQKSRSNFYKEEINKITASDSPLKIKLNSSRLQSFKNPELKEKYSHELYLELRLVTIELENGQKERLLTNIPPDMMSTEDIFHIYGERWIIKTNYKTLKKRFKIENFTSNSKENIKQDVYSTILNYNIYMKYYNICNKLVENKLIKEGKITGEDDGYVYRVDFTNLIRNLKDNLYKLIINPMKKKINFFSSGIIKESCLEYNKIKKYRKYPRIR